MTMSLVTVLAVVLPRESVTEKEKVPLSTPCMVPSAVRAWVAQVTFLLLRVAPFTAEAPKVTLALEWYFTSLLLSPVRAYVTLLLSVTVGFKVGAGFAMVRVRSTLLIKVWPPTTDLR